MTNEGGRLTITTGSWLRGAFVVLLVLALVSIHNILLAIFTSIVIASAVEPAAVWARKRGFPRLPAVLAVYAFTAILLAGLFYFLFLPLLGETVDFARTLPDYSESISEQDISNLGGGSGILGDIGSSLSLNQVVPYVNSLARSISQGAFSSFSLVFGGALSFILIIVLSFYLAVQEDGVGKFLRAVTPLKHEKYIASLWKRSQTKIGLWMQGQLLLALLVMVLVYLGLLLIGIPHALLLAVLAGVLEIIPLFGPVIAAIPALFVAFAFGGLSTALVVMGLFLIIQQFENHLIYPLVVKKVVGVPPMVSIIALLIGGQLAGFLGIIIAVPVAAVLMELLADYEEHKIARSAESNT